jgi:perosamine synthetase
MSSRVDGHFQPLIDLVRTIYGQGFVPLHRPVFDGNEKRYLAECIDSNFVSSVGAKVSEFEAQIAAFTGSRFAVATVNGTAALHVALQLVGVTRGDEVVTQALSFIATCNALSYAGASPVFVDVDRDTMGMSPQALDGFLEVHCVVKDGRAYNRTTGKRFAACVPMHTFGHPCRIDEIVQICGR